MVDLKVNVTSMAKQNKQHLEYNGVVVPIMNFLNSLPQCKAINIHGSVFCERGTPDITGSIQGRSFWFECKKSPRKEAEDIQKWRLKQWRSTGAIAERVDDVQQVREILKREGLI